MKNIFDYKDTITGDKSNVLDFSNTISKVIGVVMFLLTFGIGQKIYQYVDKTITNVDAGIDPITRQRTVVSGTPSVIRY